MMSWTEHVSSTGGMRNGYVTEFYLGSQKGRNCLGDLDLEGRIENMDCTNPVQDRDQ